MNICFLDLDGVLNSQLYYMSGRFVKGSLSSMDYTINQIDPVAMDILNEFVEETDCKIVISSSWRKTAFYDRILYHSGFIGEVIDITPSIDCSGSVRGNEILKWLYMNENVIGCDSYDFKKYVIFDDDSDMLLCQKNHFFQTDTYSGLTPNVTYRAKRFLETVKNRNK